MVRLSRIAPEVPVSNLQSALEYYQQNLGFEVVMEIPGADYAIVERDDVAIHLFCDEPRPVSPIGLHIFTNGLDELQLELERRGARVTQKITRKPWGNREFRVSDDSGNELRFTEPLAEDA